MLTFGDWSLLIDHFINAQKYERFVVCHRGDDDMVVGIAEWIDRELAS